MNPTDPAAYSWPPETADRPDATGLREAVEALADEWRADPDGTAYNADRARDLRALLAAHPESSRAARIARGEGR